MWVVEAGSAWNVMIGANNLHVREYFVKQSCHGDIWKDGYGQKQNEKSDGTFFEVEEEVLPFQDQYCH